MDGNGVWRFPAEGREGWKGIVAKIHGYKDIGYDTYSKLFNSCVAPVTDYCSGVW